MKGRNPGSVRKYDPKPIETMMVVNVTWAEFNLLLGGIRDGWDWRENEDGMAKVFEPQMIRFIRAEEFPMLVPHEALPKKAPVASTSWAAGDLAQKVPWRPMNRSDIAPERSAASKVECQPQNATVTVGPTVASPACCPTFGTSYGPSWLGGGST